MPYAESKQASQPASKQQFNSQGKEGNKKIVITAEATSKQAIEQHQS